MLNIKNVIKLYEQVSQGPFNYIAGSPCTGSANWFMPGWDIMISRTNHTLWGPITRWGRTYHDIFEYVTIEITSPDFLIQLDASMQAMGAHTDIRNSIRRSMYKNSKHEYTLEWCGDVSILEEVFVYHDLVMPGA